MIKKKKTNKLINKLKKVGYFFLSPFQKLYWFIFRPNTRGVKTIIEHNGEILLVRLGYAHQGWTLPGGGVKPKESFEDAARREIFEEVGILSGNPLIEIGEYSSNRQYKHDTVKCFFLAVESPSVVIDDFEIVEARWFKRANFPENIAQSVSKIITFYDQYKSR